jgi:hypothetical protein
MSRLAEGVRGWQAGENKLEVSQFSALRKADDKLLAALAALLDKHRAALQQPIDLGLPLPLHEGLVRQRLIRGGQLSLSSKHIDKESIWLLV